MKCVECVISIKHFVPSFLHFNLLYKINKYLQHISFFRLRSSYSSTKLIIIRGNLNDHDKAKLAQLATDKLILA